ncbi:hypothetical protein FN846DRAFT_991306 [Sphaerosporella brunnea]|uniref:FHA domain-containing protein n=1 Tax=Sphaerosporella brunnea TaxID=1250544 RepID=A0A5J5F8N3_9PEZI|nr:hypothetical protein FN846DRAFT_991306 [Sphaerosporella brunnea]
MWLLECDDHEALQGKRMWLRPGSRCVLGRVKQGDVMVTVTSSRTISRRHLVINIADVNEEDGVKIHARTQITMQDFKTKYGTRVDDTVITGSEITLDGRDEHIFWLGNHEHAFRIKWTPVVFSFSLVGKDKLNKNVMAPYRAKVEKMGIKTIPTWADNITTHVVATKRNTAMGLQALITGRHIVTSSYLDAIVEAAQLPDPPPDGSIPMSKLEIDFDANWPNPAEFLPPPGNEPTSKPAEAYKPDPRRKTLFEGWTFVFSDDLQYQNLLGPITAAGGKSEKFTLNYQQSRPEELVGFIEKHDRGGDVCVVRFRTKNPALQDWERDFAEKVQELLGFRMVDQNEFIEIILGCDTAVLRRPLYRDSIVSQELPPPRPLQPRGIPRETPSAQIVQENRAVDAELSSSATPASSAPSRPRLRTRKKLPAIDPFDFEIGGDFFPAPTPEPSTQAPLQSQSSQIPDFDPIRSEAVWSNDNPTGPASMNALLPTMEVDEPPSSPVASVPSPARKRAAAAPDRDENLDIMDLLPGARTIKRRKIAEEAERRLRAESSTPPEPKPEPITSKLETETPKKTTRGKKPETPYEAQAREIKEREEAEAAEKKAAEESKMEGLNIEGMKNLALVETVKLKANKLPRTSSSIRMDDGSFSGRWKPEWNGRKNFKGFRRAGRPVSDVEREVRKVGFVAYKGKDYGLGDGYWEDNNTSAAAATSRADEDSDSESEFRLRSRRGTTQLHLQSQTSTTVAVGVKRRAPAVPPSVAESTASNRATKKPKLVLRDADSSSDSEDDGLKFKLRRRR